jgi:uncharacterized surface protein with fasciclin (FAS1) repeats
LVLGTQDPLASRCVCDKPHDALKTNTPSQREKPEPVIVASRFIFGARKQTFFGVCMKKTLVASFLAIGMAMSVQAKDIVDTAVGAGTFKTLATALGAADLVPTLKGKGPFTVFAPTDEAFAKIPKADLDALLKDKKKLAAVLTYHVVPGKVMAANVKAGKVKTVQGSEITITTTGGVMVNNAKVIKTDIVADNGVIHVIDTVIMPK